MNVVWSNTIFYNNTIKNDLSLSVLNVIVQLFLKTSNISYLFWDSLMIPSAHIHL